jgi:hypothetical protein
MLGMRAIWFYVRELWELFTSNRAKRFFERAFHWQYSSVVIPLLWGLGATLVGIATAENVSDGLFVLGRAMMLGAMVWGIGGWLTSRTLRGQNPRSWGRSRRRSADLGKAENIYHWTKWGVSAFILFLFIACYRLSEKMQLNKSLSSYEGVLYPANEPNPLDCLVNDKDELAVFMEDKFGVTASRLPLTVFHLIGDSHPIMKINRSSDGSIAIDLDIRSDDQKVVVQILKNHYHVNHNNVLMMSRQNDAHDLSSLSVTDQYGNEVLNIHYLNVHAFSVKARLSMNGHVIDTSKLPIRGGGCFSVVHGPEGAAAFAF